MINIHYSGRGTLKTYHAMQRVHYLNECGIPTCLLVYGSSSKSRIYKEKALKDLGYKDFPVLSTSELKSSKDIGKYKKVIIDEGQIVLKELIGIDVSDITFGIDNLDEYKEIISINRGQDNE